MGSFCVCKFLIPFILRNNKFRFTELEFEHGSNRKKDDFFCCHFIDIFILAPQVWTRGCVTPPTLTSSCG